MTTLVREARANATEDEPVFFLNAGDTYQGNQLFSHYHYRIVVKFLNILGPDVAVRQMCFFLCDTVIPIISIRRIVFGKIKRAAASYVERYGKEALYT